MGRPAIDLTGMEIGRLTVLSRDLSKPSGAGKSAYWLCQCECGTIKEVMGRNLRNGRSKSCGCYKKEVDGERMTQLNKARALDLRGEKYGLLTPIRPTEQRLSSSIVWECLCECGNDNRPDARNRYSTAAIQLWRLLPTCIYCVILHSS